METTTPTSGACWFVGAYDDGADADQTARFINEGIWENGYRDKYLEEVKAVPVGARIAIKAAYIKKRDLPFDNRGHVVSVMAIKAVGTVTENPGDGRRLKVAWQPFDEPREWYFHTHRGTVWRVEPDDWKRENLIAFAFEGKEQDIARFRNSPYWRERFGDNEARFQWTRFYEAFADKLLEYRERRAELLAGIRAVAESNPGLPIAVLNDHLPGGIVAPLADICPFTTIGIFNRGIKDEHRQTIARGLAEFLGVDEATPDGFAGIPVLNNQNTWFFSYADKRRAEDIDILWEVFAQALALDRAGLDDENARRAFAEAYDRALTVSHVKWNLGIGLYWVRPWIFPTLDGKNRAYIEGKLHIDIGTNGPGNICNGDDYLKLTDDLNARFEEENFPVHSQPELSLAAWLSKKEPIGDPVGGNGDLPEPKPHAPGPEFPVYTVENIMRDGCFLDPSRLHDMLKHLRGKKNLILEGPPGTGKTWLAKRLAFALMGQRDESRLLAVQFHPNLSYEDFIRGWRPAGDGKLVLADGPFMEMVAAATRDPRQVYVVVIEEINRGNPAQIFGEMLTLLEADKRTPDEALALSCKREPGERVFIPDNLYVIGTMNIADRSLALVDLALRRRFAFVDLEPAFGPPWRDWVEKTNGIAPSVLRRIEERLLELNADIAADSALGPQFRIGHSYVTPASQEERIEDGRDWFRRLVATEIGPLLDEYWHEAPEKAKAAKERLLDWTD